MSDGIEYIVGIDPGITGAIAFFCRDQPDRVVDVPTMLRNKKGNAQTVNGAALADLLEEYAGKITHAYIELVTGQMGKPGTAKMGNAGAFQFGRTFGSIEQAIVSARIPISHVHPQVWKRRAGLYGAEKDASRTHAIRLWPSLSDSLKRKKDIGRAEALLIAHYGSAIMERTAQLEAKDPFGAQRAGYE